MQRVTSVFATMALLGLLSGPAAAVTLIKDEEARLPAAAAGLALLNSFSNLGGFFGPYVMGWFKQQTGSYTGGMVFLSGMLVVAGISVLIIGRKFFGAAGPAR